MARRLKNATATKDHQFWSDDPSLCDTAIFDITQILTPRHLTDIYLLALAVSHDARLVTLDHGIPTQAVLTAKPKHLLVL
jgi:uncharacterized protein